MLLLVLMRWYWGYTTIFCICMQKHWNSGTESLLLHVLRPGCLLSQAGTEYLGTVNVTASGLACRKCTQTPYSGLTTFADGNASAAMNYCRNPNSRLFVAGVWCFTDRASVPWELCDVPMCGKVSIVNIFLTVVTTVVKFRRQPEDSLLEKSIKLKKS